MKINTSLVLERRYMKCVKAIAHYDARRNRLKRCADVAAAPFETNKTVRKQID